MLNQAEQKIIDGVIVAMSSRDMVQLGELTRQMAAKHRFLYSFLGDTLRATTRRQRSDEQTDLFLRVVRTRMESLANWQQQGNETVAAIQNGEIDANAIKPLVRREARAYDEFYSGQSEKTGPRAAARERTGGEIDYVPIGLGANVNNAFRLTHVVSLAEAILGMIAVLQDRPQPVRWIDVGCGTGRIANAVNPRRFGVKTWEIVGCDFQDGKIAVANSRRTKNRNFFCSDAFEMLDNYRKKNESFDLVSMFEFLEHLDDPLRLIRRLDTFKPKFVLAASPLGQKMGSPRDITSQQAHLWSFTRRGWEQMFQLAGFEVVYSSEVRVGTYIGGLNWLSVVCGPQNQLRARRQTLAATDE
jgi:SAM-dependent methyltransferase